MIMYVGCACAILLGAHTILLAWALQEGGCVCVTMEVRATIVCTYLDKEAQRWY